MLIDAAAGTGVEKIAKMPIFLFSKISKTF